MIPLLESSVVHGRKECTCDTTGNGVAVSRRRLPARAWSPAAAVCSTSGQYYIFLSGRTAKASQNLGAYLRVLVYYTISCDGIEEACENDVEVPDA